MKKNYIALARMKVHGIFSKISRCYYKCNGLRIGNGGHLGKILCDWPNNIIIGNNCDIEDNVVLNVTHPFDAENTISIGNNVFIGHGCQFKCNTKIIVKDDCLIASGSIFIDTGHEIAFGKKINAQPIIVEAIILEEDVWIGAGCKVLKGVTIGRGSVVGAGSVVNKSIPEFQIWAGTPARFIRNRY